MSRSDSSGSRLCGYSSRREASARCRQVLTASLSRRRGSRSARRSSAPDRSVTKRNSIVVSNNVRLRGMVFKGVVLCQ